MKDITSLKEYIESNGNIRTKEAIELGYNSYDLRLYLEANKLIKKERGVYILPEEKNNKTEKVIENEQQAINEVKSLITNYKFDDALEIMKTLYENSPNNGYYIFFLSYIYCLKEDYTKALEYLFLSQRDNISKSTSVSAYLISLVLSNMMPIEMEKINALSQNISLESMSLDFFNNVYEKIVKGEYRDAQYNLLRFLNFDYRKSLFRVGNQYLNIVLIRLLKIRAQNRSNSNILKSKEDKSLGREKNSIARKIEANRELLRYVEAGDYDKALEIANSYSFSEARETLISLIYYVESLSERKDSPIVTDSSNGLEAREEVMENKVMEVVEVEERREDEPIATSPKEDKRVELTKEQLYDLYLEAIKSYDYVNAKKALIKYEMKIKSLGECINLDYLYKRLERDRKAYEEDEERFIKERELYDKIYLLINKKKYDASLEILEGLEKNFYTTLLRCQIYLLLNDNEKVMEEISLIDKDCVEPEYLFIRAQLALNFNKYDEALEYCFKYNERLPKENVYIYLIMVSCYENLGKAGKAVKTLRIVQEINNKSGKNVDLSKRINHNEKIAMLRKFRRENKSSNN